MIRDKSDMKIPMYQHQARSQAKQASKKPSKLSKIHATCQKVSQNNNFINKDSQTRGNKPINERTRTNMNIHIIFVYISDIIKQKFTKKKKKMLKIIENPN